MFTTEEMRRVSRRLSEPERRHWSGLLEGAVGTRCGTPQSRKKFADAVLDSVGIAVAYAGLIDVELRERGRRATKQAAAKRKAFDALRALLETPTPVLDEMSKDFDADETKARFLNAGARRARPGRQIADQLAVAEAIAHAYHIHIGHWPSCGMGGGREYKDGHRVTNGPYHRVCDVVEQLFRSDGLTQRIRNSVTRIARDHPFKLGDVSRIQGIKTAKEDAKSSVKFLRLGDIFKLAVNWWT